MTSTLKRLWRNQVLKTVILVGSILILVAGLWFGLPTVLNTKMFPVFTVISGSMCIPPGECDSFSHAFERTLHIGDLIVIQGVDAKDLKTEYPNSDIIVFRNPMVPVNSPHANIVHRIVDVVEVDGILYFHTKGDGNSYPNVWPQTPIAHTLDNWQSTVDEPNSTYKGAISEEYIYGKVVMRIPWIGLIAMLSQQYSAIPIIIGLCIILLIIFEFVLPLIKKKPSLKQITTEEISTVEEASVVEEASKDMES